MEVLKTLTLTREEAQNGVLAVFGRKDWRSTRPADMEALATRSPIPVQYWDDFSIDGINFKEDRRGLTYNKKDMQSTNTYLDLWFDKVQIDLVWPSKRKWTFWIL